MMGVRVGMMEVRAGMMEVRVGMMGEMGGSWRPFGSFDYLGSRFLFFFFVIALPQLQRTRKSARALFGHVIFLGQSLFS